MASPSEAFEKFSIWKNLRTSLKVTVIIDGKTDEVLVGWQIFGVDSEASQVGISNPSIMHSAVVFDVEESAFSIESTRLVATRKESDWLIFEELD